MRLPLATWPALCLLAPQPTRCAESVASEPSAKAYHASDQYLEEYGTLYDHLGMLSDHERMRGYHDAIRLNAESHFKGKVVLDVGTGTGVLAIWAAQAGARRVFAVEGTSVAQHAETMAKAHGFGSVIEVLRGRMEDVQLPEPVDVIVSEWMGYFLLRESMIQSVIFARDRWLRPGGVMYPSSARLLLASLQDKRFIDERELDSEEALNSSGWYSDHLGNYYYTLQRYCYSYCSTTRRCAPGTPRRRRCGAARTNCCCPPLAAPQLGSCTSSARAWRRWAARHSQSEAQPLGAPPPPPWGLKRAASKVTDHRFQCL